MSNRILNKTSATTASITPDDNILRTGELGYSYVAGDSDGGDRLFIGVGPEDALGNADYVHIIGGKYYTDMMDHPQGKLTAKSAIITDDNNKIDQLFVDNLHIDGHTIHNTAGNVTLKADGNTNGIIRLDAEKFISAEDVVISAIADPVDQQDAVNLRYLEAKTGRVFSDDGNAEWRSNNTSHSLQILGSNDTTTNIETSITSPTFGTAQVNVNLSQNIQITTATIGDITVDRNTLIALGDIVLDPNGSGGTDGTVIIQGDLQVDGTTTTINSTELTINDKLIVLADGSPDSATSNGGGILLDGAGAKITYNSTSDEWQFNKDIYAPNLNIAGGLSSTTLSGVYLGFDSDFAQKTTTDLTEGNNLYYTTTRFDSDFNDNNTDQLTEGQTNLYYTTTRFDSDLGETNTGNLPEGTNLYFTNARARRSLSADDQGGDGDFSYDDSTGVFTYRGPNAVEVRAHFSAEGDLSYDYGTGVFSIDIEKVYTKTNFDSDLGDANTGDLPEGTNLYYTTARFDSDFGDNNTDQLPEGVTNLYFTDERVDDRVSQLLSMAEGLDASYNDSTGVFTLSTELATATNIGAASFDSNDFLVTSGNVEINVIDCGTF